MSLSCGIIRCRERDATRCVEREREREREREEGEGVRFTSAAWHRASCPGNEKSESAHATVGK